ncbi:hypothetical protein DIE21_00465 [Burkholderia sp. Bp9140]|uniref:hypothetical protein n=1 Tax=Burkholderia sp. Bp9140 TaxID=2184572 RepID=UPI000F5624DC|nr:hypothetical protein [Burkholderia sp. Bp9140]RQR57001.1 hypothetical protein DIE21_00465 [Burkholderia sp. Bp9140]
MSREQIASTHSFTAIGSLAKRNGWILGVSSGLTVAGLTVACVDGIGTVEDDSEAAIADGA